VKEEYIEFQMILQLILSHKATWISSSLSEDAMLSCDI